MNLSLLSLLNLRVYLTLLFQKLYCALSFYKVMGPVVETSLETTRFPKINGSNYYTWANNMKSAL